MPIVSQKVFRGNRRVHPSSGGRNRLDGGDDRENEGLEDEIISGEVVLPPSAYGDGRTWGDCFRFLLRPEGLLPRRAPDLAILPGGLPDLQASLSFCGSSPGSGIHLVVFAPHTATSLPRADGVSSPRADA